MTKKPISYNELAAMLNMSRMELWVMERGGGLLKGFKYCRETHFDPAQVERWLDEGKTISEVIGWGFETPDTREGRMWLVLELILEEELPEAFTLQHVYDKGIPGLTSKQQIWEAIRQLVAIGVLCDYPEYGSYKVRYWKRVAKRRYYYA